MAKQVRDTPEGFEIRKSLREIEEKAILLTEWRQLVTDRRTGRLNELGLEFNAALRKNGVPPAKRRRLFGVQEVGK